MEVNYWCTQKKKDLTERKTMLDLSPVLGDDSIRTSHSL